MVVAHYGVVARFVYSENCHFKNLLSCEIKKAPGFFINPDAVAPVYSVFQAAHTPNTFCRYGNASTNKTDFCCRANMCPARFYKQGITALNFRFSFLIFLSWFEQQKKNTIFAGIL